MAQSISSCPISGVCWSAHCPDPPTIESQLMDTLNSEVLAASARSIRRTPFVWKFWGTAFWGLIVFAAMFVGQMAVLAGLLLWREGPGGIGPALPPLGGGPANFLFLAVGGAAVPVPPWGGVPLSGP